MACARPARPDAADLGGGAGGPGRRLGGQRGWPSARARPERVGARRAAALGAYGAHPVRLLVLGDSIAMTLGHGAVGGIAGQQYGVTVSDHATWGVTSTRSSRCSSGAAGPATPGCDTGAACGPSWPPEQRPGGRPGAGPLGGDRPPARRALGAHRRAGLGRAPHGGPQSAIAIFHAFGARVVLFTMPYVDPSDRQPDGLPWSENTPARAQAYNALVRQVARPIRARSA